jgi:molybdopterin adenylyltransferase
VRRRAVVLTVSDSVAAGTREDRSGPAVAERLKALGWEAEVQVLPDEPDRIAATLASLADSREVEAVFTTGGTGVAPRDRTPEATRQVVEREIPGIAEWMRLEGRRFTPRSLLSRGIAGTRGRTLIVNLPGSPKGAVQSLDAIADVADHVVDLLHGRTEHTETDPGERTSS